MCRSGGTLRSRFASTSALGEHILLNVDAKEAAMTAETDGDEVAATTQIVNGRWPEAK